MDLLDLFTKATDLQNTIDPAEKPYASKYKARKLLEEIIENADKSNEALIGGLYANIGIIDVDTEELSNAEVNLLKALEHLCNVENREFTILQELKVLNQLGILWCLREDYQKAKTYLDRSLQSYQKFTRTEFLYEVEELLAQIGKNYQEKEQTLELLNTHTYYYLAQVYEKIGDASKSAECCYITLSKQLELKQFQHLDWATNASLLSQHYLAKEEYKIAKRHLIASSVMLDRYENELNSKEISPDLQDDRQEMLLRTRADLARAWGKYCLLLLQRSMDKDIEDFPVEKSSEKLEIDFPSIENDPDLSDIPENYARNFEEARAIFLPAQRFLNSAKSTYYKFQDHCVDFVDIQRDLSHMHKVLVHFEPDLSRKFKMQKRRIDLLEPTYKGLSVKHFTLLVRQLAYEVAETYSAMMDLKLEQNSAPTKVNSLIGKHLFLTSFCPFSPHF